MTRTEHNALQDAYDTALETWRAAARDFRKAQDDYRKRRIDDAAYLAAAAIFQEADRVHDVAENVYVQACEALGPLDAEPLEAVPVTGDLFA